MIYQTLAMRIATAIRARISAVQTRPGGIAQRDLKSLQDGAGNVGVSHTHYTFDDDGSAAFRNKKGSGNRSL
jgi:hypothetical protein